MKHRKRLPTNRQLRTRRRWFDDCDEEEIEILIGFADALADLSKDIGR